MAKFRKKPVVIEAIPVSQLLDITTETDKIPRWAMEAVAKTHVLVGIDDITIRTLEGNMRGAPGDMLIRGVTGELYPCKSDIFEATYEPVEE